MQEALSGLQWMAMEHDVLDPLARWRVAVGLVNEEP